jgi:hypothetical protein
MENDSFKTFRIWVTLAWLEGCVITERPEWLSLNCTKESFEEKLRNEWPFEDDRSLHSMTVQGSVDRKPFCSTYLRSFLNPGRIVAYTQRESFLIFWKPSEIHPPRVLVRTLDRKIAGTLVIDRSMAQRGQAIDQSRVEFIAMSVHDPGFFMDHFSDPWSNYHIFTSLCAMYGCPCATNISNRLPGNFVECPEHTEFYAPVAKERLWA